jgi:hypothetical protein
VDQCRRDLTTPTNEEGGRRGGTATKLLVLDCGLTSPGCCSSQGRSIRPWAERYEPVEWVPVHHPAVVVETPEGTMLWDTSCPRDWEERLKAVSNLVRASWAGLRLTPGCSRSASRGPLLGLVQEQDASWTLAKVHARMRQQPSLDPGGLVGRGVVTDDVQLRLGWHRAIHLRQEPLELHGAVARVSWEMTLPEATSKAASRLVVPWRV